VQLIQIVRDADGVFFLFKYQLVILKGKAFLHGTVKSRVCADGIPHVALVSVFHLIFHKQNAVLQLICQGEAKGVRVCPVCVRCVIHGKYCLCWGLL